MSSSLGDFETLILLALVRLGEGEEAYGISIRREIEERAGRSVAVGALYTALGRLERRGYVSSYHGEPTARRGGRRKKHYLLEPSGRRALSQIFNTWSRMTEGIEAQLEAS